MVEIYELAYKLHMPVYKLLKEMPYEELLGWFNYFKRRPAGWQDDQRTHMMLQAQGVKEKGHKLFPSLAALRDNAHESDDKRISQSLVTSGLLSKLQGAAITNGIEWGVEIDQNKD